MDEGDRKMRSMCIVNELVEQLEVGGVLGMADGIS